MRLGNASILKTLRPKLQIRRLLFYTPFASHGLFRQHAQDRPAAPPGIIIFQARSRLLGSSACPAGRRRGRTGHSQNLFPRRVGRARGPRPEPRQWQRAIRHCYCSFQRGNSSSGHARDRQREGEIISGAHFDFRWVHTTFGGGSLLGAAKVR